LLEGNESREDLLVPLLILFFLACAWFVFTFENRNWLPALGQVAAWMLTPTINYTPVEISGLPVAFLATIEILFLGFTSAYLLLGKEQDTSIKIITTVGLGFGLTGLVTTILGIFGDLYPLPLNTILPFKCTSNESPNGSAASKSRYIQLKNGSISFYVPLKCLR
jgi:hypothetical protein